MVKRSIRVEGVDGTTLNEFDLDFAVAIKSPKKFLILEQLPNGKWRLGYTTELLPEITEVDCFQIVRED